MAVNVTMGVDIGGFTAGIREGQQILKGLNAEMKASEAEFKATGNAEEKTAKQTKTLTSQLNVQKGIADQARAALEKMTAAGVDPASTAYQKMYVQLMNAEAGANEAQAALNALGGSAQQAAGQADQLTSSMQGISKKISLDQIKSGIDSITSGLERAAQKAIQLGEQLFSSIMDSARWADDTATMAQMYGIDVETFQKMQKLVTNGLDTTVEAVLGAQDKLKRGNGKEGKEVTSWMRELGVAMYELQDTGGGILEFVPKDADKIFWETGQALMGMGDAFDKEAAATALFGKSWKELVPLFQEYKTLEEYNAALDEQNVVSEENVKNLADLNDKFSELQGNFDTLKKEVLAQLAPALTEVATSLNGVLQEVLKYLNTAEGKEKLGALSDAVTGLFSGLKDINAEDVASKFGDALDTVTDALTWIKDNKDGVITALEGIFGVWATLKVGSGALTILKVISGLKDLMGFGGAAAGGAAAGGGGATGLGLGAALKAGITNVAKTLPFAAPLLAFADGLIHDQEVVSEMMEAGNVQLQDYASKSARYAGAEQFGLWDTLTKYISVAGGAGAEDAKGVEDFAKHYMEWFNDDVTDTMLDTMVDNMVKNDEEAFDQFHEVLERIANGELFETEDDRDALKAAMENVIGELESEMESDPAMIPTDFSVPDDAAAQISEQIGTVTVSVKAFGGNLLSFLTGGSHANGLPFVPYDGYLALLHQGERVLTASQNRSYTYNSNNYFGNVNLNNGQDIDALCDRIDRRNRRQRVGYGA